MIRPVLAALTGLALIASSATPALAAPCRDAKGKFLKCPTAKPMAAAHCRNTKGKFAKCGTPGAKPA